MYPQISLINRPKLINVFHSKIHLSHVLEFGRERKSVIGKLMGNDQLQQSECRQVITFDDSFL